MLVINKCMQTNILTFAAKLSDGDLRRRLEALAGCERQATVELVAHLAEFDARKLHRAEGYALFSYCTEALRLSEHATYNRIEAARACRSFPMILDLLTEGAVNLSTVRLLAPHLSPDNHKRLLAEARGRSKREIEALVARIAPQPDVPASVRKLPAAAQPARVHAENPAAEVALTVQAPPTSAPVALVPSPPAHRPVVAPLAPERYRVQFTVSRETQEKLRRAQDLLRREIPDGDPAEIFDRALTLLLEDVARKKMAATSKPRPSRGTDPHSRYIPAEVRRKVWVRDGGQCAFVANSGRRCRERVFLDVHHVEPHGIGGETTAANVSLRCRAHNVYEAELVFGPYESAARETPVLYTARNGPVAGGHLKGKGPTRPGASWLSSTSLPAAAIGRRPGRAPCRS